MQLPYHIVDVFTDTALAGNPLAVVLDVGDLSDERRRAIAREFNLSETVFVEEPDDPVNTAKLRIFTPARELPFAGHPTVGTAALIAHLRAPEMIATQDLAVVLEERIGAVECIVRQMAGRLRASFALPRLPQRIGEAPANEALAQALGLGLQDIGFPGHVPSMFSAGVPFYCVPLAPGAIGRAWPHPGDNTDILPPDGPQGIFVYSRDVSSPTSTLRARMFSAEFGAGEDPATGSAVAALAGALVAFEAPADGSHDLVIEQGFEMGRPSLITLGMTIEGGALSAATIGGGVVRVAEGRLHL